MKPGTLIVFEGLDGSGKSTQAAALASALSGSGRRVVVTKEPTDGPFGRRIRAVAASGEHPEPGEELRWFLEDRREHVRGLITPALAAGALVISDRYYLSTVAYQGARGHDPERLLAESEAEFPRPDLVLLLEIEAEAGLSRVRERGGRAEPVFEELAYLRRVAAIFASLDRPYLARIDARSDEARVRERVRQVVRCRLGL